MWSLSIALSFHLALTQKFLNKYKDDYPFSSLRHHHEDDGCSGASWLLLPWKFLLQPRSRKGFLNFPAERTWRLGVDMEKKSSPES